MRMLRLLALYTEEDGKLFEKAYQMSEEEVERAERKLFAVFHSSPMVLIVTCMRIEIYYESSREFSSEYLKRMFSLPLTRKEMEEEKMEGEEAALHLLGFSSGVISPLFGDDTIPFQIRSALNRSRKLGHLSSRLNKLFSLVTPFSRQVHQTFSFQFRDQVLERNVLSLLKDKEKILVIGSGFLARTVSALLLNEGKSVTITLRDKEKVELVPPGAKPVSYEERYEHISGKDAIITATGGLCHVFGDEDEKLFEGILLIDLASPPDLPANLGAIRVNDLTDGMAKKAIVEGVYDLCRSAYAEYLEKLEKEKALLVSEDVAYECLRRMDSTIDSSCIEDKDEFRERLFSSIKNAYIKVISRRKE